jgi:uncharacterized protein (TIGR03083 family)
MLDLATARQVTVRELGAMVGLAEGLATEDWERPTRCAGWTVRDVCAHAALAAGQQAEAFRRAAKGVLEPPDFPGVPRLAPAEVVDLLHAGRQGLDEALGALPADVVEGMTPMPFGVVPTVIAIQIPVYEFAFHVDDARTALGQASALPADVAAAFVGFFPGLAGRLASRADPGESTHAYRFVAPAGTVTVAPGDDTALPVCTITGPNDAIALFCMGRIGIDDARLAVDEAERTVAGAFKRWFPGP